MYARNMLDVIEGDILSYHLNLNEPLWIWFERAKRSFVLQVSNPDRNRLSKVFGNKKVMCLRKSLLHLVGMTELNLSPQFVNFQSFKDFILND